MKITACQLYEYRLKLRQPLVTAGGEETHRHGLLIRTAGDTGSAGWGEATPLPGFSKESPAEAQSQLKGLLSQLPKATIPPEVETLNGGFENWLGRFKLCSSARCAVETAVLNLQAAEKDMILARMLSKSSKETVPVNGLITGSLAEATAKAGELLDKGYRTVKMKVGRLDPEADAMRVVEVSAVLGGRAALRLDTNRAWGWEDALRFARGIDGCEVEYIEEPLNDPARLRDFTKETGLPVAIDETTREIEPDNLPAYAFVAAVVLKPTLLGGFEKAAAFARAASNLGAKVVFTSTFESPVGIAALAHLAAAYGSENTAAGLETVNWFEQQLLTEPVSLTNGRINLSQTVDAVRTIDLSQIEEVNLLGGSHG